jgi:WD40 repeat protein
MYYANYPQVVASPYGVVAGNPIMVMPGNNNVVPYPMVVPQQQGYLQQPRQHKQQHHQQQQQQYYLVPPGNLPQYHQQHQQQYPPQQQQQPQQQNYVLPVPQNSASFISSLTFSPFEDILCCTSWDGQASYYRFQVDHEGRPIQHQLVGVQPICQIPILDVRFVDQQTIVFGGGDGIYCTNLATSTGPFKLYPTDGVVSKVRWMPSINALVSTTWTKRMAFIDPRQAVTHGSASLSVMLPERAYAMDAGVSDTSIVVACADRHLCLYDARNPQQPVFQGFSPLRFQTRDVALFDRGFGICGVGEPHQVSVLFYGEENLPANSRRNSFSWQFSKQNEPANVIVFRPTSPNIVAVGSSNGITNVWSILWKSRQLSFKPTVTTTTNTVNGIGAAVAPPSPPQVVGLAFSKSGTLLASVKTHDILNPTNGISEVLIHWVGQKSASMPVEPKQQHQQQGNVHQQHHHHNYNVR